MDILMRQEVHGGDALRFVYQSALAHGDVRRLVVLGTVFSDFIGQCEQKDVMQVMPGPEQRISLPDHSLKVLQQLRGDVQPRLVIVGGADRDRDSAVVESEGAEMHSSEQRGINQRRE